MDTCKEMSTQEWSGMKIIDANHKPAPHPFYGDSWERGVDPWHADAFPDEFKHAGTKGPRKQGWFLVDGHGNAIGFVPDSEIPCPYCQEGAPEWSPFAKVWIHRRPKLDRRCLNQSGNKSE